MKNDKSYSEIMKSRNNGKKQNYEMNVLDIYIQMVLDESLFIRRKSLLEQQINAAIDSQNKQLFMQLSEQYKKLLRVI